MLDAYTGIFALDPLIVFSSLPDEDDATDKDSNIPGRSSGNVID